MSGPSDDEQEAPRPESTEAIEASTIEEAKVIDMGRWRQQRDALKPKKPIPFTGAMGEAYQDALSRGLIKDQGDGSMRLELDNAFMQKHGNKLFQSAISSLFKAFSGSSSSQARSSDQAEVSPKPAESSAATEDIAETPTLEPNDDKGTES